MYGYMHVYIYIYIYTRIPVAAVRSCSCRIIIRICCQELPVSNKQIMPLLCSGKWQPCWQKPCWQIYAHGLHRYVGASAQVAPLRKCHQEQICIILQYVLDV